MQQRFGVTPNASGWCRRLVASSRPAILTRRLGVALAVAVAGVLLAASTAGAFGKGNAAWNAYYKEPGNAATWAPFCAGGGGTVKYSGDGVPACGPRGSTWIEIPGGISTPGFQCVELSERFLYVTHGWTTLKANGAEVAAQYHSAYGVPLITNGTAGVAPHVGDVMSFSRTSSFSEPEEGHTGVVTASAVNSSGNGTITLLSENVGETGNSTPVAVTGWRVANLFGEFPSSEWIQSGTATTALHTAVALITNDGASGYTLDGYGGLHPFGNAPAISSPSPTWPNWDIARGIAIAPNSTSTSVTGYVLDGWGGIHPFAAGAASAPPPVRDGPYWPGWDIARGIVLSTPTSGYVLDGWGGIHPFATGSTPDPAGVSATAYWPNWDIARGIVLSTPTSGYVLDGWGGVHPFAGGGASMPAAPGTSAYWPNWDIARSITLATPTTGYVLDGFGGIHPFAPAGASLPSLSGTTLYWPGWDVFDTIAFDPATGTGVDANAAYLDGSGDTLSTFHGPVISPVTTPSQPSHGALGTSSHSVHKKKISPLSRALAKCRKIKNHRKRAKCQAAAHRRYGVARKKKR
jgi:hypothetical protein